MLKSGPTTNAHHGSARAFAGVSRFSHPSFAPRTLKQQTVCIVCQRWFVDPKIKNTDPKSRFYNTLEKPQCYFRWLGERADTPEAQAEFLAAPYKGEGRLTSGWRQKEKAACEPCARAATKPQLQQRRAASDRTNKRPGNQRCRCVNFATCNGRVGKKGDSCVQCQAPPSSLERA